MRFRKLRIAWSGGWGVVAVLLIVLWVRSYCEHEVVYGFFQPRGFLQLNSNSGTLQLISNRESLNQEWRFKSQKPSPNRSDWLFKLDMQSRFGWWLTIRVPYWFLLVLFAGTATTPWVRISNRFSLRTMLVATTLVAVGLGLIVWSIR